MPALSADARWYVIRTARFKENYVEGQLRAIAGAETYVPLARVPRHCLKHGQSRIEPLFPGYVFARLDLTTQRLALRRLHAFRSVVSFDGRPAAVDPAIIAGLRQRERGRGYINLSATAVPFQPYDTVRVTEGPFRGLIGHFVRYENSTARISLLMDILRPQAVLELPLTSVTGEKLAPAMTRSM